MFTERVGKLKGNKLKSLKILLDMRNNLKSHYLDEKLRMTYFNSSKRLKTESISYITLFCILPFTLLAFFVLSCLVLFRLVCFRVIYVFMSFLVLVWSDVEMLAMRRYFLITMRKVENFVKAVLGLMYHLTCKPFIKHIAGHPIDDIYPFGAFSNVLIGEGELEAFLTMYCTLSAITIFRVYKWD